MFILRKALKSAMKDLVDPLVNLYKEHLNLVYANFSSIDHLEAMVALVYKIRKPNGEQFILKICDRPNDYLREVYFLKYFAKILKVPKIIQLVEPTSTIAGAILMEYLPGNLLQIKEFNKNFNKNLSFEIGKSLGLIHLKTLAGYGDLIENNLSSDPKSYFNFPRLLCFWRICKRLLNFSKKTADTGCLKGINWTLIKYIWNFNRDKLKSIELFRKNYPHVDFIIFNYPQEAKKYLEQLIYLKKQAYKSSNN